MTTYTITIDEKTKSGKSLIAYLRSLGIVQEPDETTIKAMDRNNRREDGTNLVAPL